jgi:hypothetical protein
MAIALKTSHWRLPFYVRGGGWTMRWGICPYEYFFFRPCVRTSLPVLSRPECLETRAFRPLPTPLVSFTSDVETSLLTHSVKYIHLYFQSLPDQPKTLEGSAVLPSLVLIGGRGWLFPPLSCQPSSKKYALRILSVAILLLTVVCRDPFICLSRRKFRETNPLCFFDELPSSWKYALRTSSILHPPVSYSKSSTPGVTFSSTASRPL